MTSPRGRHQPADPTAAARDGRGGAQAPIRRVVAPRRGIRQQAGLVGVGAVLLTVIGAGIGLGGRGDEPPPSGSDAALAGSAGPTGSQHVSGRSPSPTPDEPCVGLGDDAAPEVLAWPTTGDAEARDGLPAEAADAGWPVPEDLWPVPPRSRAVNLARRASIVVTSGGNVCIQRVLAEYRPAGGGDSQPLADDRPRPPVGRVVLGHLPTGNWILAVAVTYARDADGEAPGVEIIRFFRVLSDELGPEPSPLVTPTVPCAPLSAGDSVPDLYLTGSGDPVRGVRLDTFAGDMLHNGAVVNSAPGELLLTTADDTCMTSWAIQWLDQANGSLLDTVEQPNSWQDPRLVAQNRLSLHSSPLRRSVLTAFVHFGPGLEGSFAWEVVLDVSGMPLPVLRTADGRLVDLAIGCGIGWTSPEGGEAYESCERYPVPPATQLMAIGAGETVDIEVRDAVLTAWGASCGQRDPIGSEEFVQPFGCDLGSGSTAPIRVLPWPGAHVIQVWLQVELPDGTTFFAPYFVEILAGE